MARVIAMGFVVLYGCSGTVMDPPAGPEVTPAPPEGLVPAVGVESRIGSGPCAGLQPGERLVAVGSEGDAWVAGPEAIRVIEVDGAARSLAAPPGAVTFVQPLGRARALVVADGHLFRVSNEGATPVALAERLGAPREICGDIDGPGPVFLSTSTALYELAAGQWWRLSTAGEGMPAIAALAPVDGACSARDASMWLRSADGEAWRLRYGDTPALESLGPVDRLRSAADGPVAVADGELLRGEPWRALRFEAGDVRAFDQGGPWTWALVGDRRVYLVGGDEVVEVDHGLPAVESVHAHAAGGAWLVTGGDACHASVGGVLRVRGVRPYQRRAAGPMRVVIDAGATASLDGAPLDTATRFEPTTGWHAIELSAADGASRRVEFAVLPGDTVGWDRDVRPIAERSCAGRSCHSADGASGTPLTTFDQWRARAATISARVVAGEMPRPPAALTREEVDVIRQWVEQGARP